MAESYFGNKRCLKDNFTKMDFLFILNYTYLIQYIHSVWAILG